MRLTTVLLHLSCLRWLSLWQRDPWAEARLASLVANPTRKQRQQRCLWCWKERNPNDVYPAHLTSSMCAMHSQQQRSALAASRAARRKAVAA